MTFRLWWLAAALLNVPISVSAQSCAVQAPSNGTLGTCPSSLSSGSTCQFSCNTGYTLTGSATYCSYGQLTAQTCVSSSSGAQLLQISVSGTIASITQFPGTGPVTVAGIAPGDQFNWTGIINTSIPSYPFAGYADWTTSDSILSESFTVGGFTWSSGSSSPLPPYMATACCGMFGVDLVDFYANQPGQGPSIQTSVGTLAANNWSIQLSAPTGTLATAATPNQTALERFSANSMTFQFGGATQVTLNASSFSITIQPVQASTSTDGPVPLWALGALGTGLIGIASRSLKKLHRERPRAPNIYR